MTLLSVSKLYASLGGRQVLHDVSLTVSPGEFVGLIGPNGAGKSTLLRSIVGLVPSTGGLALNGTESINAAERARLAAYIAQSRDIAWAMSVEALVALGRTPHLDRFAPLRDADRTAIESAMQVMDVTAFRHRPATELSGGELARVLIARALAQDAPLLLADEPTAGLDPSHQIVLMQLFLDLAGEGRAVVASTHDLGLAARCCTRLILLHEGRVVADGAPETVLTPHNLASVYGVRAHFGEADGRMVLVPIDLAKDKT